MCTKNLFRLGRRILTNSTACTLALVTIGVYCEGASAEQWSVPPQAVQARVDVLRSADLEKAFWLCDYTATNRGVHAVPAALCSAVTDELRHEKFGGNFEEMLRWWQQNKPAEHDKLASGA